MGSYGIGPARVMAAIVEQHHDEHGIVVAAVGRAVRRPRGRAARARGAGRGASRRRSTKPGRDVLLDDRDQRAGEKFADADLIGCPVRVTVGKKTLEDGAVDVRDRETGEEQTSGDRRTR